MPILELVKNGGVTVLSTMSSYITCFSFFSEFEQQGLKKIIKNKKTKK
jgi:hypothetical protein